MGQSVTQRYRGCEDFFNTEGTEGNAECTEIFNTEGTERKTEDTENLNKQN